MSKLTVEKINGFNVVVGHIFEKEDLVVNSHWVPADGSLGVVKIVAIEKTDSLYWVAYSYNYDSKKIYEKDSFSFQCRYCLIVE